MRFRKCNDALILEKLRMYTFCRTFHCTPEEYNNTLCEDVDLLLEIHKEVKQMELDEVEKQNARNKING